MANDTLRADSAHVTLDRRALLGAAPLIAAAVAVPAVAIAATGGSTWDAAMRVYLQAEAEYEAFTPGYGDLCRRWREACAKIPHVTFPPDLVWGSLLGGEPSTANHTYVKQARKRVADV